MSGTCAIRASDAGLASAAAWRRASIVAGALFCVLASCFSPTLTAGTPTTHPVGAACTSDAFCSAGPSAAQCVTQGDAALDGLVAPGGYCTATNCDLSTPNTSCGPDATCYVPPRLTVSGCFSNCTTVLDCRSGYLCEGGLCLPPVAVPDAGMCVAPGQPCTASPDCCGGGVCLILVCVATDAGPVDAGPPDAGPLDAGPCGADFGSDPSNCGHCANVCPLGTSCVAGECATPSCAANPSLCEVGNRYCDTTTGACRTGCVSDSSCGNGRLCDLALHQCVSPPATCSSTGCPTGHVCESDSAGCIEGCETAADCPSGDACASGTCAAAPAPCVSGHCPLGQYCVAGSCLPGCAAHSPCVDSASCTTAAHQCTQRPTANPGGTRSAGAGSGDTPGYDVDGGREGWTGQTSSGALTPPDCSITGCAPNYFCDQTTWECRLGCTSNLDCTDGGPGWQCNVDWNRCQQIPPDCRATPSICPAGQSCDQGDGVCKSGCASGSSCAATQSCDSATQLCLSACNPKTCGSGNYCDDTGNCVAGCEAPSFPCDGGVCDNWDHLCGSAPFTCPACAPGFICDPRTGGTCVCPVDCSGKCAGDDDGCGGSCPDLCGGADCSDGTCITCSTGSVQCCLDSDCSAGVCTLNSCEPP